MSLNKLKFLALLLVLVLPTYVECKPRVKVRIMIPSSSLSTDSSVLLTQILQKQPSNIFYNLRKVVSAEQLKPIKDIIDQIDIQNPEPDNLTSIQKRYGFWQTQYLLEIIEPIIYKKPNNIFASKTEIFLGDLTKKFENSYLEGNIFETNIDILADRLNSTVNVHTAVLLLALLLDANERKESPEFKNYLIMALDNTLADIRKDKKSEDVKKVSGQISQILGELKSTITNPVQGSK